jgi:hypothetical protein
VNASNYFYLPAAFHHRRYLYVAPKLVLYSCVSVNRSILRVGGSSKHGVFLDDLTYITICSHYQASIVASNAQLSISICILSILPAYLSLNKLVVCNLMYVFSCRAYLDRKSSLLYCLLTFRMLSISVDICTAFLDLLRSYFQCSYLPLLA